MSGEDTVLWKLKWANFSRLHKTYLEYYRTSGLQKSRSRRKNLFSGKKKIASKYKSWFLLISSFKLTHKIAKWVKITKQISDQYINILSYFNLHNLHYWVTLLNGTAKMYYHPKYTHPSKWVTRAEMEAEAILPFAPATLSCFTVFTIFFPEQALIQLIFQWHVPGHANTCTEGRINHQYHRTNSSC